MSTTLTIEIDKELAKLLEKSSQKAGLTQNEWALEALKRQLSIETYKSLQSELRPYGKARGWETDEETASKL